MLKSVNVIDRNAASDIFSYRSVALPETLPDKDVSAMELGQRFGLKPQVIADENPALKAEIEEYQGWATNPIQLNRYLQPLLIY